MFYLTDETKAENPAFAAIKWLDIILSTLLTSVITQLLQVIKRGATFMVIQIELFFCKIFSDSSPHA